MDLLTAAVTSRESDGQPHTLIELTGEVDVTTSDTLREVLEEETSRRPHTVIIDLSGLRFMDSSALHVIFAANRELAAQGGTLALVGPQKAVATLLRVTEASQVVPIYPTLPEATAG
jgi:anti-sigma B factor antagonist